MGLASLVLALTAFLFILLIWISSTIHVVRQFYFSGRVETLEIHKWLRNTTISYLISYCFAYFCALLLAGLALSDVQFFWTPNPGYKLLIILIAVSGSIGFMSFYLFVASRLYYSFKPTQFKIRKRKIHLYIVLSLIVAILLNIYAATYFLNQNLLTISLPIAIIAVVLNLYIAISLVYFFTNNLTKFASFRPESTDATNPLSPRQENYLNVAAKHCLLGCIGISMFNIFIPITICFYVWIYSHTIGTYIFTISLCFIWHTIEMISVLLSFAFNKRFYNKFCTFCHNRCDTKLKNIAGRKLKENVRNKERLNSQTVTRTVTDTATIAPSRSDANIATKTQTQETIELNSVQTQEL